MLMHGTADTDVPFEESATMADQLKQHGVRSVLLPIENGEHGFGGGNHQQIAEAYDTMRAFIIEHLRP
ncbi:MAG: S9 family peptidase [bacterium]|nr:S9 family peptidase [bacterium]